MTGRRTALTRAGYVALATPSVFGVLAWAAGTSWFVPLALSGPLLLAATLADLPRTDQVEYVVDGPDRVAVGDPVATTLTARNRGSRTSTPFAVRCFVDERLGGPLGYHVPALPPGGSATAVVHRTAVRRGVTPVHVAAVGRSTVGLVASVRGPDLLGYVIVHPARVPPVPLSSRSEPGDDALEPRPASGVQLAGIRTWRPGDDLRRVHWRATARHDELVVVERARAQAPALLTVVVGPSSASDWEAVVAVAASTTRRALGSAPVTLLNLQEPDLDQHHLTREADLLDWWSVLGDVAPPEPARLLGAIADRGAREALVVASAELSVAWWRAMESAAARDDVRIWSLHGAD